MIINDAYYGEIVPFKGRQLDPSLPVYFYRNLHKKGQWYSLKQKGQVVAHCTSCCISGTQYLINRKAQVRIRETGKREVHAYVLGHLIPMPSEFSRDMLLFYNPKRTDEFVFVDLPQAAWIVDYIPNEPAPEDRYLVLHCGNLYLSDYVEYNMPPDDIVLTDNNVPPTTYYTPPMDQPSLVDIIEDPGTFTTEQIFRGSNTYSKFVRLAYDNDFKA